MDVLRRTFLGIVLVISLATALGLVWLRYIAPASSAAGFDDALRAAIPEALLPSVYDVAHRIPMIFLSLATIAAMARHGRSSSAPGPARLCSVVTLIAGLVLVVLVMTPALVPVVPAALGLWIDATIAAADVVSAFDRPGGATDIVGTVIFALWLTAAAAMTAKGAAGRRVAWLVSGLALAAIPLEVARRAGLMAPAFPAADLGHLAFLATPSLVVAAAVLLAWLSFCLSAQFRLRHFYLLIGTALALVPSIFPDNGQVNLPPANAGLAALHLHGGALIVFGLLAGVAGPVERAGDRAMALSGLALAALMVMVWSGWTDTHAERRLSDGPYAIDRPGDADVADTEMPRATGLVLVVLLAGAGAVALRRRSGVNDPITSARDTVAGVNAGG